MIKSETRMTSTAQGNAPVVKSDSEEVYKQLDENEQNLKHHLKNPISEIKVFKMKLTALSIAAVFAFFSQTMAEPLPQGAVGTSPTETFHCKSSMNISVNLLILNDLRRRRSICKLITPCEVAVQAVY